MPVMTMLSPALHPALHNALATLATLVFAPVLRLFDNSQQSWWPTYLSGLTIAVVFYMWSRRRTAGLRGLVRYLWPKRLLRRPSVKLDIKFYLFGAAYLTLQGMALSGMNALSDEMAGVAQGAFHLTPHGHAPGPVALAIMPLALYLAYEFGYWVSHLMLHRLPWLWEFHKVHHSAEVLTPLVEARQHPVECVLVVMVCGVCYGVVFAVFKLIYGPGLELTGLWRPGLIMLIMMATLVHIRHSHIKLSAPAWLSCIVQTPRQHQIHHSIDPRHFDRNLGFCLSVFDWLFGTLYIPKSNERLTFGLYDEAGQPDELMASTRLVDHLWRPFQRAFGSPQNANTNQPSQTPPFPAE